MRAGAGVTWRDAEAAPATEPLRLALGLFAVLALYSGAAQYGEWALGAPRPLYAILALVGGGAFVLVVDPGRPSRALRSPLLGWALLYLAMGAAWGLWRTSLSPETDQVLVDRLRSVGLLGALVVAFDDPRAARAARLAAVAVAVASSVVNVGEELGALPFADGLVRFPGRAAGLYVNPNEAGLAIVFGLAAGLPAVPRALRVPALVVCAAGTAATFSRGAVLCLAALLVVLLVSGELDLVPAAGVGVLVATALAWQGGALEGILGASGSLNRDTLGRLAMTASDSGRVALAEAAWRSFLEAPWAGHGVAAVREARTAHNMYLSLAVEHGVFGLVVFPGLALALALRNRAGVPLAVVLLVAGVFNHGLLELSPSLVCLALADARARAPGGAPG